MNDIIKIKESEENLRLDKYLRQKFPSMTQAFIQKGLRKGDIRVSGKKQEANYRLKAGDEISVRKFEVRDVKKSPLKLDRNSDIYLKNLQHLHNNILFKDDNILAINKPAGLPSQGGSKVRISVDQLLDGLKFDSEERPKLVHRIDKDTSGVMVLARHAKAAAELGELFKNRDIEKTYITIVVNLPEPREGKISAPIFAKKSDGKIERAEVDEQGQRATTFYRVLDTAAKKMALVEAKPVTGRMHQIRVHMAHIGCPILGDGKYGGRDAFLHGITSEKMHLHAYKIKLPMGKKTIEIKAPLSAHIKQTIKEMNFEFRD